MKTIIFTGTRAEFGLLTPLMRELEARKSEASWLATGMHLLPDYGHTIELVRQDPAKICAEVEYFTGASLSEDFGAAVAKFAKVLEQESPDWLVILGDRHESLAATIAASQVGVPVAHLHGGDKADSGHMDEAQRHAITRFAGLHFAASEGSAERLRKFGEQGWRIHCTGAPGIDRLRQISEDHADEIAAWANGFEKPFLLTIFHPLSIEADQAAHQAETLFTALDQREEDKLVIFPNNDPGGAAVLHEIKAREGHAGYHLTPNLNAIEYVAALQHAAAFVGNSSSGVIEAPFFGLPLVHVGRRNFGREHAGHVRYVEFDSAEIENSIRETLAERAAGEFANLKNPYGDGHAAQRAADLLEQFAGDDRLLAKMITY